MLKVPLRINKSPPHNYSICNLKSLLFVLILLLTILDLTLTFNDGPESPVQNDNPEPWFDPIKVQIDVSGLEVKRETNDLESNNMTKTIINGQNNNDTEDNPIIENNNQEGPIDGAEIDPPKVDIPGNGSKSLEPETDESAKPIDDAEIDQPKVDNLENDMIPILIEAEEAEAPPPPPPPLETLTKLKNFLTKYSGPLSASLAIVTFQTIAIVYERMMSQRAINQIAKQCQDKLSTFNHDNRLNAMQGYLSNSNGPSQWSWLFAALALALICAFFYLLLYAIVYIRLIRRRSQNRHGKHASQQIRTKRLGIDQRISQPSVIVGLTIPKSVLSPSQLLSSHLGPTYPITASMITNVPTQQLVGKCQFCASSFAVKTKSVTKSKSTLQQFDSTAIKSRFQSLPQIGQRLSNPGNSSRWAKPVRSKYGDTLPNQEEEDSFHSQDIKDLSKHSMSRSIDPNWYVAPRPEPTPSSPLPPEQIFGPPPPPPPSQMDQYSNNLTTLGDDLASIITNNMALQSKQQQQQQRQKSSLAVRSKIISNLKESKIKSRASTANNTTALAKKKATSAAVAVSTLNNNATSNINKSKLKLTNKK